jgi:hypothetical protein
MFHSQFTVSHVGGVMPGGRLMLRESTTLINHFSLNSSNFSALFRSRRLFIKEL